MKQTKINKSIYRVLLKLFLLLIIVFLGFYLFFGFYLPSKYITIKDENLKKWECFYKGEANADILILGSSKALRGYDTKIISAGLNGVAYNFAELGMSLSNYPRFLHDYLKQNKPPEYLLINADIFGFNHRDRISTPYYMMPFMPSDSRVLNEIYQFRYIKYFKPYGYFFYKDEIYSCINFPETIQLERHGFHPLDRSWKDAPTVELNIEATNSFGFDSIKSEKYFAEINDLVKRFKIRSVYIVMSPVFYNYLHSADNWKEISKFTEKICNKYNFIYVDLLENNISKEPNYFYDAIHFNKTGSDVFSKNLIKIIRENSSRQK